MAWKAGRSDGINLPTSDVPLKDDQVLNVTSYYPEFSPIAPTTHATLKNAFCGIINPFDEANNFRTLSANHRNDYGTNFTTHISSGARKQMLVSPVQTYMKTGSDAGYDFAMVEDMKMTMRVWNQDTAQGLMVFHKLFYPDEDNVLQATGNSLKEIVYTTAAGPPSDVDKFYTVLMNYPGMKLHRLGPNTANGLPNMDTINLHVDCNKMVEIAMRRDAVSGNVLLHDQNKWAQPHPVGESIAHDRNDAAYAGVPFFMFWCLRDNATVDTGSLMMSGIMKQKVRYFGGADFLVIGTATSEVA